MTAPRVTSSLAGLPLSPRMLFSWTGPPLTPALSSGADPSCLPTASGPLPGRTPLPTAPRVPGAQPGFLAGLLPPASHLRPHPDHPSGLKDLLEPWSPPRGQPPTRIKCHHAPSPRHSPNPAFRCPLAPPQTRSCGPGRAGLTCRSFLPGSQPTFPENRLLSDESALPSAPLLSVTSPGPPLLQQLYFLVRYLLSTYCVPGIPLRAEETAATGQTGCLLALLECTS